MKTIKAKAFDFYCKAQALLEQLKVSEQLETTKKQWEKEYYAHNPEGKDYESTLKKLGLLDRHNLIIPFISAQAACPATFCFQPSEDGLRKSYINEANDTIFYNLVVPPSGKTLLEVFRNDDKADETYRYNAYDILLNLPYLLSRIVEEASLKQVRENLESFLKGNATCTLANIYAFAKKDLTRVKEIPATLLAFNASLVANGRARTEVYQHTTSIPEAFWVRIKRYGEKVKTAKYSLEAEASGPVFRTEFDYQNYYYRRPSYKVAKYKQIELPVKILIKENEVVPLYLPASFFEAKEPSPSKESLCLLSLEEKIKEEVTAYVVTGKGEGEVAEAYFREEMTRELKSINRALKKFLKNEEAININRLQKEKLELLKLSEETLQKSTNKLTILLSQLYKKEVVLNNL